MASVAACAVLLACSGDNKSASVRPASSDPAATGVDSVSSAAAVAVPDGARTVLFLGTSLTAGLGLDPDSAYPQQLQRKIDSAGLAYQTVNAGVSGETSAGLLRRLDWVLQNPAAVIVVETGANDGLRGQPVEGTKATIGAILTRIAKDRPEATVVLIQMEAPPNMGVEYTRAFHAMFPALAAAHGVTLLPFLLDGVAGHAELNQGDGVHPNDVGEKVVISNVWRGIQPILKSARN
ncbi:arylesterase [soil metagenome]